MAKENNIQDLLCDVADAIREKKGTTDKINPLNFSDEIKSIPSSIWTGHVDAEGLREIGWTEEDIAYFQEHGVNWMAEDDEYHKVSDDNKALYGVLTADNISEYKDRIVYLPKIDTSGITNFNAKFYNMPKMVALPHIDTSSATSLAQMFKYSKWLTAVPPLDTSNVTSMVNAFEECFSLQYLPQFDFNKVNDLRSAFAYTQKLQNLNTVNMGLLKSHAGIFTSVVTLTSVKLLNLKLSISILTRLLSKTSLLYMIENEAAESEITITLHADAYARLAEDVDIVAALENHPLITIAS